MKHEFKVGQKVVVEYNGKARRVATIRKVWKNGVVELEGAGYHDTLYNPDGTQRGRWTTGNYRIRPLRDNETPEGVEAAIRDKERLEEIRRQQREKHRQQAIKTWWEEEGLTICNQVSHFDGTETVRWESDGKSFVGLIRVRHRQGPCFPVFVEIRGFSWNEKGECLGGFTREGSGADIKEAMYEACR